MSGEVLRRDGEEVSVSACEAVGEGGQLLFYDTTAGLHHALRGTPFSKEQNAAFSHRFAGTYAHLLPIPPQHLAAHEAVCRASSPLDSAKAGA